MSPFLPGPAAVLPPAARVGGGPATELGGEGAVVDAFDWTGFVVSFKGVFLEGLEVAFIVLTFGTNEGRFDLSIAGAAAALVLVAGTGIVIHRPLSRVPENAIKFAVG